MNHFCAAPWYSKQIKTYELESLPCCLLPSDTDVELLKNKFLDNKKPQECKFCWDVESQGKESQRSHINDSVCRKYSNTGYSDEVLNYIISVVNQSEYIEPIDYQIEVGNLCNAACVTCVDSQLSSKWRSYRIKNNMYVDEVYQLPIERIPESFYINATRVNFLGGEPLYNDNTFEIIEKLDEYNNHDILITIITNGSVQIPEKYKEIISKFNNFNFCFSIDGIGKVFDYIRYPLKWDNVIENILQAKIIANHISVNCTISNLNKKYINEVEEWCEKQNIPINFGIVQNPKYFSPDVTPSHPLWETFTNHIKDQDNMKSIHINDYIPYYNKYFR